jgi:hypothetical protein
LGKFTDLRRDIRHTWRFRPPSPYLKGPGDLHLQRHEPNLKEGAQCPKAAGNNQPGRARAGAKEKKRMKWKSAILTLLLLSTPRSPVEAAPAYSLEGLLKRAEIVYVGCVSELSLEKQ